VPRSLAGEASTADMLPRLWRVVAFVLTATAASTRGFLPFETDLSRRVAAADDGVLGELLDSLRVMQDAYFQPWLGTWPTAIDWTAAVMGTEVSGALRSLSKALEQPGASRLDDYKSKENLLATYFSQMIGFYFGQDAFSIRNQAYDDILWVVLGWLETIEFINSHSALYAPSQLDSIKKTFVNGTWYGNQWIPPFAHRARVFWDLSTDGWDTKLCGGGMNWNPRLEPYKNAITNELFIAASASMYLYFPGDDNTSPFNNPRDPRVFDPHAIGPNEPRDKKHLEAALSGYEWLAGVGMMNSQGLYVDGFHIPGWNNVSNPNTKCNARNDMVYTYNQGVLLTGHIGLWKATGDEQFLRDGHKLVQAVINATGYDLAHDRPVDDIAHLEPGQLPPWHGIGRAGILEEQCDASGTCSQNGHTFKGIFFHHLTAFCAPSDLEVAKGASGLDGGTLKQIEQAHASACNAYLGWIRRNAAAAVDTKDSDGKFGTWWTAGLLNLKTQTLKTGNHGPPESPEGAGVDYRTYGVPSDSLWTPAKAHSGALDHVGYDVSDQVPIRARTIHARDIPPPKIPTAGVASDPNDRGRGRTVETQGGGLSVVRALWEISHHTAK